MNHSLVKYEEKYAAAAVTMWRNSKEQALGIKEKHSFEDHLYYLTNYLAATDDITLAVLQDGVSVAGIVASDEKFVNQLYIHVEYQNRGIGSQLLELAKAGSGGSLRLYTFEINRSARAFYERHGFRIIGRGSDNKEQLADILYEWIR